MEKIKIEKGTVQETLLIPLYGRKYAMDLYPDIFMDHDCQTLFFIFSECICCHGNNRDCLSIWMFQ